MTNGIARRCVSALLVLTAGVAQAVAAQVDPRVRAREMLPAETLERLEALARDAEREGIPVGPLFDKALEGAAKGIPADRILPAVMAQAERLRTARRLLGGQAGPAVVVAGADALVKGVPAESLGRFGPAERTPVAFLVLGDLVETGVAPDDAVGVVQEAMARQAGDQDLLAIPSTVRRLMRAGGTPGGAADAVRRALRDGRAMHRIPGVGGDIRGPGAPAPPGSEPLRRDGRSGRGGSRG